MTTEKIITAKQDTWLKKINAQSVEIKENGDKYAVASGEKIILLALKKISTETYYVTCEKGYGEKSYNSWYIHGPHFDLSGAMPQVDKIGLKVDKTNGVMPGRGIFTMLKGQQDNYGAQLYQLAVGDYHFECISGSVGSLPCHPHDDYPGSYRPIPEGIYTMGTPVKEPLTSCHPAIGPDWIDCLPKTNIGNRSGILIHRDWNYYNSPGTAGCIAPVRHRDMDNIVSLVNDGLFVDLVVDYGYGTVKAA